MPNSDFFCGRNTFFPGKLGFFNISKYLARYGIQMDPSLTETLKKVTIRKEACIVHVGFCYQQLWGGGSKLIKKMLGIKRLPWHMSTIEHWYVNFCTRNLPYQRESSQPSDPGCSFVTFLKSASHHSLPRSFWGGTARGILEAIWMLWFEFETTHALTHIKRVRSWKHCACWETRLFRT